MFRSKQRWLSLAALALTTALAACSGEGSAPFLGLPTPPETAAGAAGADRPQPLAVPATAFPMPKDLVVGSPTDVYTRIARGALTCWFGAAGPLKSQYIYHADAQPASQGGHSEIKIMTRDANAEDPRALRAYRVLISPSQGSTKVEIENVRIPEPMAERLKQDVERWSSDEPGCGEGPVTGGWGAEQVVDTGPAKKKKEKSKKP